MRPRRRPITPQKKSNPHRINEDIKVPKVRLVGDNVEVGVYSVSEARKIAEEL